MKCYLAPPTRTCYVHLGRFGDIMILLPAMYHLFKTTGVKPVMMVCQEFQGMLEGCSYVTPWPVDNFSWYGDVKLAKHIADYWFDNVVVPKWWDCPGLEPPPPRPEEPVTVLNHQGRRIVVAENEWDSYQYSQWKSAGFTRRQLLEWPLVFDQRSPVREAFLVSHHMGNKKPIVIYNFSGISNPFPFEPEIMSTLRPLNDRIHMVDLSQVRAQRIQDLLGLYDRALCLITGDTATLHLAAASNVPTVALLANGGSGSIPKGNTILKLRYGEVNAKVGQIKQSIENLLWGAAKGPTKL